MKKIIYTVIVTVYAVIALFTTVCLLSFNDYKITEFGNYSLIIIPDNEVNENLSKGDLVIVDKKGKIKVGEDAFFYNTYSKEMDVISATVTNAQKITSTEITYTIDEDKDISSQYLLGPINGCTKIPVVGTVLSVLESKWGFLFLVVLPALIAFIYEISVVISEIKNSGKNKKGKN